MSQVLMKYSDFRLSKYKRKHKRRSCTGQHTCVPARQPSQAPQHDLPVCLCEAGQHHPPQHLLGRRVEDAGHPAIEGVYVTVEHVQEIE